MPKEEKTMNKPVILAFLILIIGSCSPFSRNDLTVLVVAGGHGLDTLSFYKVFEEMEGIVFETAMQPAANMIIASSDADRYDVIVFYDSWQQITKEEKQAYLGLTEKRKGLVFMHHALVSYQNWPEFTSIIGGKYQLPAPDIDSEKLSGYKHDIWMRVITNRNHPVTKRIDDFDIFDEGYTNLQVLPTVTTLLTTENEFCHPIIGWAHQVENSKVVYLLPGHAAPGLHSPAYKQIILNSIRWSAGL